MNSVVSAPLLEPLRGEGIACLTLVHEFVTYIKPLDIFSEVGLWSSRVVCSTPLTWNDVLRNCKHLADVPLAIPPRSLPASASNTTNAFKEIKTAKNRNAAVFLAQLPKETL